MTTLVTKSTSAIAKNAIISSNSASSDNAQKGSQTTLKVEQVASKFFPTLTQVASSWSELAQIKADKYQRETEEYIRFANCSSVSVLISELAEEQNELISELAEQDKTSAPAYDFFVCKEDNTASDILGIMVLNDSNFNNKPTLEISYLVTHPNNIIPDSIKSVRGVGCSLINSAIQTGIDRGSKQIILDPMDGSVSFYEHRGFVKQNDDMMCLALKSPRPDAIKE